MKLQILAILLLLLSKYGFAQENSVHRSSFVSAGCSQVKESANFGLVFRGPALNYGLKWEFQKGYNFLVYENQLGAEIIFTKQIPALGFYFKPADISYLFRFAFAESNLYIGPDVMLEYKYNLYPQLQSGFDYWCTNISVGFNAKYNFSYRNSDISLHLKTAIAGFTSRQPAYRDPYFFDIGPGAAITHLNQDFTPSSVNRFNSFEFEIDWKPERTSRYTLGYVLKYAGYSVSPELSMLNNSIKVIIGKKNKVK